MTTIHGLGGISPARTTRAGARPSGFTLSEPTADTATAASTGVESVSLSGLLAMQETAPGSVRDRAARRHGQKMLEALRDLQRVALGATLRSALSSADGVDDPTQRLADLAATPCPADDPGLAEILRAIAVRAAVELARRTPDLSIRD